MIFQVIDFIFDFITNLNVKKISGAALAIIGLALINRVASSGDVNKSVLYAIAGIIIGGIGLVIIYYDMAMDKSGRGYQGTETLAKAYKQKARDLDKPTTWHMDQNPDKES